MIAGIAHLRGYDLVDPRVRNAILVCMLGEDEVDNLVRRKKLPAPPMALATAPTHDPDLDRIVSAQVASDADHPGRRQAARGHRRAPGAGRRRARRCGRRRLLHLAHRPLRRARAAAPARRATAPGPAAGVRTARAAGRGCAPGDQPALRGRGGARPRRVIAASASRAASSCRLARTLSGLRQRSPSAGRTGRRSSTSPITSTPLPASQSIHSLGLLLGPVEAVGGQPDRRRARAGPAGPGRASRGSGRRTAASRRVAPVDAPVEPAHDLGLGDAERAVGAVAVPGRPGRVDAERPAEAQPQHVLGARGRRRCGTVTTCTRSGGSAAPQVPSTRGRSKAWRNHGLVRLGLLQERAGRTSGGPA